MDGLHHIFAQQNMLASQSMNHSAILNRLVQSPSLGRRFSRIDDIDVARLLQTTDPLSSLSKAQPTAVLTSISRPLSLSASLTVAARKRSIELALERELITEEILVRAAKRRRCEQFVNSHKLLNSSPAGPSVSASLLSSILSREAHKKSTLLASPIAATSISFDSIPPPSLPVSRTPSQSTVTSAPPQPSARAPVMLCLSCDEDNLTEYQQVARQQIQFFEAEQRDVKSATKGRNRGVSLGQVGIQCRHCAHLSPGERAKGSTIYPSKLDGIYQAAQNMANGHLAKYCKHVPEDIRSNLIALGNRKSSAGGGRGYWTNGAKIVGVMEDKKCLRFSDDP